MKKINILTNGLLSKVMTLFICVMITFNCIASLPYDKLNVSEVVDVQKDIFCAVLFVSDTISKISKSFSDKIVPPSQSPNSSPEKKSKQDTAVVNKDFISLSNEKQSKKGLNDFSHHYLYSNEIGRRLIVDKHQEKVFHVERIVVFYFLILMIFYISSKRPKDEMFINYIKIYKETLFD